ncbi:MAG: sodium ion-translocating decarboxylase subunit beta, partial [Anaerolineae bacterium]|nr:sodium ion-translocating decarboxylase subunit beta [Anaerolineae bacterium]
MNIPINELMAGLLDLLQNPGNIVMILIGGVLLYFAIVKEYEPSLLLPIGVGIIIANLPLSAMIDPEE